MAKGKIRRIGVLTSGGDCAGLNAALRAVVQHAIHGYGWQVFGIRQGTRGLLDRPLQYEDLTLRLFTGNILRMGGTILGTVNKGDPYHYPMPDGTSRDRSGEFIAGMGELGLDALIGIGGDGSMEILARLAKQGRYPFIGIPKTIDNDVRGTEVSIGFSTALSTAVEALDRLQPTAASHERVMVLEVMGRDAGHIAISAGIAGGADVILIPEIPYVIERILEKLRALYDDGRKHALVVCAEAARPVAGSGAGGDVMGGAGQRLAQKIAGATGAEVRVTVLGHVQRGGVPSSRDRIIASAFGVVAVDLLAEGKRGRMVAWRNEAVTDVDLDEVVGSGPRCVDKEGNLVGTARRLDICLGD